MAASFPEWRQPRPEARAGSLGPPLVSSLKPALGGGVLRFLLPPAPTWAQGLGPGEAGSQPLPLSS